LMRLEGGTQKEFSMQVNHAIVKKKNCARILANDS
jgi:hypothetical protein